MIFLSGEFGGREMNKVLAGECTKALKKYYFPDGTFVSGIYSFYPFEYNEVTIDMCKELLDKCDDVIFLTNIWNSEGALEERDFVRNKKWINKYLYDYFEGNLYKMTEKDELILIKPVV